MFACKYTCSLFLFHYFSYFVLLSFWKCQYPLLPSIDSRPEWKVLANLKEANEDKKLKLYIFCADCLCFLCELCCMFECIMMSLVTSQLHHLSSWVLPSSFFFPYVSLCNAFDYEDWHGKVILCS